MALDARAATRARRGSGGPWCPAAGRWNRRTTRPTTSRPAPARRSRPRVGRVGGVLAEAFEQGHVVGSSTTSRRRQDGGGGLGVERRRRPVAGPIAQAGEVEQQRGAQPRKLAGVQPVDGGLQLGMAPPGSPAAASARARAAAARACSAGKVEAAGSGAQVGAGRRGRVHVASRQLGVDQDGQQLDGPQSIVADHPQPRSAAARARSWSPRARCRRAAGRSACMAWSLPSKQRLRLGQAALADAQVGEGDVGMPARRVHGGLEVGLGPGEDRLGLGPSTQLHQERRLHAVAVAGQEHRRARGEGDQPVLAEQVRPTTPPGRSRRCGSRR